MEEQEQKELEDWREDISEPKDTLRIADGQSVVFTFEDEGIRKTHADFGTSVVFGVKEDGSNEKKLWYVNAQNYNLLAQIKTLGTLTGIKVKLERKGSKRSDTRYTISKI